MTNKFRFLVEFLVDESWIADGFDLDNDRAKRMLESDLAYAYGHEIDARVLARPDNERIAQAQGYANVEEWAKANAGREGAGFPKREAEAKEKPNEEQCEACAGTGTNESLEEIYEGNCLECNGTGER